METKVDSFVREIYEPTKNSPIFDSISTLTGSLLIMVIIVELAYMWYPKLVLRAGINIGLASTRYASYENTFRLVVFGILLMGILLPILRGWLF